MQSIVTCRTVCVCVCVMINKFSQCTHWVQVYIIIVIKLSIFITYECMNLCMRPRQSVRIIEVFG